MISISSALIRTIIRQFFGDEQAPTLQRKRSYAIARKAVDHPGGHGLQFIFVRHVLQERRPAPSLCLPPMLHRASGTTYRPDRPASSGVISAALIWRRVEPLSLKKGCQQPLYRLHQRIALAPSHCARKIAALQPLNHAKNARRCFPPLHPTRRKGLKSRFRRIAIRLT
jgi:hypothetical protein